MERSAPVYLSKLNITEVLSKYDTVLLDCDGVLWHWDAVTPEEGIDKGIETLRTLNKKLLFVTNYSSHDRQTFVEKFARLAKFDARKEEVFCVSYATAVYLKEILKLDGKCYVAGSKGMVNELDEAGIPHVGFGPDADQMSDSATLFLEKSAQLRRDVRAVLVGYDPHFNYAKMYKASSYLMNDDCAFIATNVESGVRLGPLCCQPVTGAFVSAIQTATKRQPFTIGKPNTVLLDCIKTKFPDLDPKSALMVGDSLRTDIAFANNCGMDSLLVLTGNTSRDALENVSEPNETPTYVTPSLADLTELMKT